LNPIRFILLMPWGRVGSNLLFSVLQKSRCLKLNNEALNQLRSAEEQTAWFKDFYEIGCEQGPYSHIGSKQNLMAIRNFDAFSRLLRENAVRIVRLRRDNHVKTAVSQMRAELYAEKTGRETGIRRWAVRRGNEGLGPTRLDPDVLLERIGVMENLHARLMTAFPDEPLLDIEYEEINTSLEPVVDRLRQFLGLPGQPFTVPFVKATPDSLFEAIANFPEIRNRLAGTPWMAQLHA
jgi:hypothetical protein